MFNEASTPNTLENLSVQDRLGAISTGSLPQVFLGDFLSGD